VAALWRLNYITYCLTIQIVKAPSSADEATEHGRRPNRRWQFAVEHPLHGVYVQMERSKLMCPRHAGPPRPRFPKPPQDGEEPSAAWYAQLERAVEFYVANFVPWSASKPVVPTEAKLMEWMQEQRIVEGSLSEEEPKRVCAAGALQLLHNYVHGLRVSPETMQATKQYRMCHRRIWAQEEREAYEARHADERRRRSEAENEIDALRSRQEARQLDVARAQRAVRRNDWLQALQNSFAQAVGSPSQPANTINSRLPSWAETVGSLSPADVQAVADKIVGMDDSDEPTAAVAAAASAANAAPPAPSRPPPSFVAISDKQYAREFAAWRHTHGAAFDSGEHTPMPPLNPKQRAAGRRTLPALRRLAAAQRAGLAAGESRQEYSARLGTLTEEMHFLLVGAPGTGKSHLLGALLEVMQADDLGGAVFSAYTGVAVTALPLPAATYCTLFGIHGDAGSKLDDLPAATAKQKLAFEQIVGDVRRLILLVLDEVSFIGTPHLHHLDQRLRQHLGCDKPFGGLVVIFAGDFHQLQPVSGYALHSSLVLDAVSHDTLKKLGVTIGKRSANGADQKGVNLLRNFRRLELTQQMRAAADPSHSKHVADQRNTRAKQPVTDAFIHSLQPLTIAAIKREKDALRFAKIGVLSNLERHAFNYLQARAWAKHHGRPLFWWRQQLTGIAAGWINNEETSRLYQEERAGLCFFFVEGAPASITCNIETGRGLVNGCDATLHSLTLPEGMTLGACMATACADQEGVLEVEIPFPPFSINVVPHVSIEARAVLLARGATLKDDTVVLSLSTHSISPAECMELCACGGTMRADVLTVRASNVDSLPRRTALLAHGAKITGELVVPIIVGKAVDYKPTSVYAAEVGIPKLLRVLKHQLDLAFAVTDYKVQGKTLDYFILSIGPRPNIRPFLTLTDLHVLISRVRLGKRLFVIGFDPKQENEHLKRLKPLAALAVWEAGYDEHGTWDAQRAATFAVQLASKEGNAAAARRVWACKPSANRTKRGRPTNDAQRSAKLARTAKTGHTKRDGPAEDVLRTKRAKTATA